MRHKRLLALVGGITLAVIGIGCGGPDEAGLRDSFAAQLAANKFLEDVQRSGDEVTFSGAGADGGTAKWRVHIDASGIEPNDDEAKPYKGTVKSSWYSDGKIVQPSGTESHLPIELTSNGLAQECYALWNKASQKWEWE
jgi:hypothetical protein